MGFFTKDQESQDQLQPLTRELVTSALETRGDHYTIDEDGDVGGWWDGCLFYFFLYGQDKEIFQVRGRWWGRLTADQYDQALRLCNAQNTDKIWPKAYLRTGDDGVIRVFAEVSTDYEHGLTTRQLALQIRCALATSGRFFDTLNEAFPAEAAAAKAEFEA